MIDLDGTICHELSPFERPLAEPLEGAVDGVNRIKDQGHTVVIWTGRGWDQYRVTTKWLDDHGFRYDQLLMGKPIFNLFIDDRSCRFEGWDRDYLELAHGARK
jgi:hypothetical protein